MKLKNITVLLLLLLLAGCGPSYVWGDDADTARQLLQMVPQGSSLNDLRAEAGRRGWKLDQRNTHIFEAGEPHYFGGCDGKGDRLFPLSLRTIGGRCGPSLKRFGYSVRRKSSSAFAFDVASMRLDMN